MNWVGRLGLHQTEVIRSTGRDGGIREDEPRDERMTQEIRTQPVQISPLTLYYFKEIRRLCREHGIRLVVLESNVSETRFKSETSYEIYSAEVSRFLHSLGVPYLQRKFVFPDEAFGRDGVHLKDPAARQRYAHEFLATLAPYLGAGRGLS